MSCWLTVQTTQRTRTVLILFVSPLSENPPHDAARHLEVFIPCLLLAVRVPEQVVHRLMDRPGHLSVAHVIHGGPSCCNVAKLLACYAKQDAELTVWNEGPVRRSFDAAKNDVLLAVC